MKLHDFFFIIGGLTFTGFVLFQHNYPNLSFCLSNISPVLFMIAYASKEEIQSDDIMCILNELFKKTATDMLL